MPCEKNREFARRDRGRRLAALAGEQDGVLDLEQLRELGVSQRAASHRAEQGAMHRVHRATYAVGHRSLGRLGVLRAAVLACGKGALVSHGTAAAYWGLRDPWPSLVDVLVPNQKGRKIDGVRCRRCRYPSRNEIVLPSGIPLTAPMRTLVDLAGMLGIVSLRRAVERAAVLDLLDLEALDDGLRRAKGRRGISRLGAVVADWRTADGSVPDVRSDFEALVLPLLLAHGVPRPRCNETLRLGGRRLMVDFLWEDSRVVVETDGEQTHGTPIAFQRDRERDQILTAADFRVIRVTWNQVQRELAAVAARIERTLEAARPGS